MKDSKGKVKLIRVVLAHGQALVGAGTSALLERIEGIQVIGLAAQADDLLETLKEHEADIVVLDSHLPGLAELDLLRLIRRDFSHLRVIVLSGSDYPQNPPRQDPVAVSACLSNNTSLAELVLALRTVADHGSYDSPNVAAERESAAPLRPLTRRQTEVLEMIARGRSTKQIGLLLGISSKTVETHRAQINERLAIHTLAGLVRYAIQIQLVDV